MVRRSFVTTVVPVMIQISCPLNLVKFHFDGLSKFSVNQDRVGVTVDRVLYERRYVLWEKLFVLHRRISLIKTGSNNVVQSRINPSLVFVLCGVIVENELLLENISLYSIMSIGVE